jgi:sn-glycerol 3-phosphate transport system permease protein
VAVGSEADAPRGRPRVTRRAVFKNRWLPYLLVLPQVAVTLVFFFWPAFESLRLSLFRTSPFGDKTYFVGLENFGKLLASADYYQSVVSSFVFAFGVTALGVAAGLFVAALATQKIRGLTAYRTALLWPYGIAPPVAGIIWLFIFHPSYGVLPYFLSFVTAYEFNWFIKGWVAMALVIAATAWTHVGYNIAFFLAGLLAIPDSLLEAASVDGAGGLRRFWSIVFPLLSPITFFLVVVNMVFSFFESFGVIHAVTQGGPGSATEIMVFKAYKDGFIGLNLGSSAAQSVILMAVVIVLTALQFRFVERRVTY